VRGLISRSRIERQLQNLTRLRGHECLACAGRSRYCRRLAGRRVPSRPFLATVAALRLYSPGKT